MKIVKSKFLSFSLKVIFLSLSLVYVINSILNNHTFFSSFNISSVGRFDFLLFSLVALLMLLNWGVETYKWKILLLRLQVISFRNAFISVLGGLAISLGMPNRTGEFVGRVMFLEKDIRMDAGIKSILGSAVQFLVTLIFGLCGTVYIEYNFNVELLNYFDFGEFRLIILILLLIIMITCILLVKKYLYSHLKVKELTTAFLNIDLKTISIITFLSIFRYIVFVLQYCFLLIVFDIQVGFMVSFSLISMIFLFNTIVPSFFLTEAVTRSAISVLVFTSFSDNSIGITAASVILWGINIVLPALLGWFFVFRKKSIGFL